MVSGRTEETPSAPCGLHPSPVCAPPHPERRRPRPGHAEEGAGRSGQAVDEVHRRNPGLQGHRPDGSQPAGQVKGGAAEPGRPGSGAGQRSCAAERHQRRRSGV